MHLRGPYSPEVFDSDAEENAFELLHPLFRTILRRRRLGEDDLVSSAGRFLSSVDTWRSHVVNQSYNSVIRSIYNVK